MPAPNLTASDFHDVEVFGLAWKDKYVQLGRAMPFRQDNKGNKVSLPAGAIGYVASATPGTILAVFATDPRKVPEPTGPTSPVTSKAYGAVITLGFNDWKMLGLKRTR